MFVDYGAADLNWDAVFAASMTHYRTCVDSPRPSLELKGRLRVYARGASGKKGTAQVSVT